MFVKLFKKKGTYLAKADKDGESKEKRFVNFYVQCGDQMIPIEVSYFPSDKFEGRDPNYNGRKQVLDAFSELLPDRENVTDKNIKQAEIKTDSKKPTLETVTPEQLSF